MNLNNIVDQASIKFWKTHVGHDEEIRSQHLTREEKNMIVNKLKIGISIDRILDDVKKVECNKLSRFNLASRKDINYLTKKHNIDKRRHDNDVIAVGLKVQEWNQNGKNYAFFFKQEGENFVVGFMNATMEKKLKDFGKIICMDGTHCTNRKGMDLTIMLVKDDKNAGFPVAFFLTNRLDQVAQELFLGALKKKVGEELQPDYFMCDDDPKYYNSLVLFINMALESLNNLLKTNQIKRRTNITVEKLLDKIEDLVDSKMWQRILDMERPNANSYQDKVTLKRHKTAERMDRNLITEVGFGEFQEKEDNSVLGDVEALGDQSKEIKNSHQEEIQDFIESKRAIDEGTNEVDREAIRRMGNQEILNALNELDFEIYSKKLKTILKLIKQDDTDITNKRKMEKQEYFPTKRRRC
ncbi:hypothetical protein ILUMI_27463 [Ignelater luminosus]|uniref:ZSWIM1/3 RNaseH-like domain-containing protein n=1 Tax=Ignelater luminosus TaxID=2038154 RepID=A0A8K0C523_IGNLU|nr:hypothetical protein ILUMI_27463 [Ignelater luminosus]